MKVLGLSGYAGTGKNYLARTYLDPLDFLEVAFADQLKLMGVVMAAGSYDDFFKTKPQRVREWMQIHGTELGRDVYGQDCWVDGLFAFLRLTEERWGLDQFVVTDVRFPNEVEGIKARGGHVLRIEAPERAAMSPLTEEQRQHRSETALDDYENFDGYILNDPIYQSTVDWQIRMHLYRLGWVDQMPHLEASIGARYELFKLMFPA